MTKQEKIVEVCRDVLLQLERGKYTLGHIYLSASEYMPDTKEGDLQQHVDKIEKCYVCAIGAALMSKARLYNNVPIKSVLSCRGNIDANQDNIIKNMNDIFSARLLYEMEAAYERTPRLCDDYCISKERLCGATAFGESYINDRERMVAIMENIIDNNGEFVFDSVEPSQYFYEEEFDDD